MIIEWRTADFDIFCTVESYPILWTSWRRGIHGTSNSPCHEAMTMRLMFVKNAQWNGTKMEITLKIYLYFIILLFSFKLFNFLFILLLAPLSGWSFPTFSASHLSRLQRLNPEKSNNHSLKLNSLWIVEDYGVRYASRARTVLFRSSNQSKFCSYLDFAARFGGRDGMGTSGGLLWLTFLGRFGWHALAFLDRPAIEMLTACARVRRLPVLGNPLYTVLSGHALVVCLFGPRLCQSHGDADEANCKRENEKCLHFVDKSPCSDDRCCIWTGFWGRWWRILPVGD